LRASPGRRVAVACAGAALAAALGAGAAACSRGDAGGAAHGARHDWTNTHRLVIAAAAEPRTLDPILGPAQPTLELSMFLFSYAIRYDDRGRPVPDALTEVPTPQNGDVSRDGRTLRYRLRRDAVWNDGVPLSCSDLRFTWRAVMNARNDVATRAGYDDIATIDCSDPHVAVVHMKRTYAPFLQQLWSVNGNAPILPEHVLARYNDARGSFNQAPYHAAPTVTSGPYRFRSWRRGGEVRLEANERYFRGRPAIQEIVYRPVPDGNTLVFLLRRHEADLVFGLPESQWSSARSISGFTAIAPVVYSWTHIDFNLRSPLFRDAGLRRALTYALDRRALVKNVGHGLGELTDTIFSPSLYRAAYDSRAVKYPYSPARARALLDAAGWTLARDGIRVRRGRRLQFTISTQTESLSGRLLETQVQAEWRAVGADVSVKNYPGVLFFDNDPRRGILQGGKYDTAFFAWTGAPDLDMSAIYSGRYVAPHGQNALGWDNRVATAAMDDANATIDPARRIRDYAVVQREFARDDPSIILWYVRYPILWNDDVKGITATPAIAPPFWNTWAYHY
jgi:peptide/nickel transport system substrate-binding protein